MMMKCRHCGEDADWEIKTLTPEVCVMLGVSTEPFQTCTECMAVWILTALAMFTKESIRTAIRKHAEQN